MNYKPAGTPHDLKDLPRYLSQELSRILGALSDSAPMVFYRNNAETELSLSAADSANSQEGLNANIVRVSTSNTVTLTGIAETTPFRERTFINVGTGVLVLKSEGTESSASYRFALPAHWNLSAGAAATLWYDPYSSRHRGLNRT